VFREIVTLPVHACARTHGTTLRRVDSKIAFAMWMHHLVDNNYMNENVKPPLHSVHGYKHVKTWSEFLPVDDFELLFKKLHLSRTSSFSKASKNNLYSYYPVGKVPAEVAKKLAQTFTMITLQFSMPLFLYRLNVSLTWKPPRLSAAWMITLLLSLTLILLLVRMVVLEAFTLSLNTWMPSAPTMTTPLKKMKIV
jgi:hypothetical protein